MYIHTCTQNSESAVVHSGRHGAGGAGQRASTKPIPANGGTTVCHREHSQDGRGRTEGLQQGMYVCRRHGLLVVQ